MKRQCIPKWESKLYGRITLISVIEIILRKANF